MTSLISTSISDAFSVFTAAKSSVLRIGIVLLAVFVFQTSTFSQVVINEVVTDPQQDWSANDFNGTPGVGTVSSTDEWIELYITASGVDLTNWTIEITDSGFFSGDLTGRDITGTGAFQISTYFGTGSFTNTQAGDYLVLGNPLSSENMTNSVHIILRDNTATLIDEIEIGSDPQGDGAGDEGPSGNAGSVDDESVGRISNGTDTGNDVNDLRQVISTMGSENGRSTVFVDASAPDDTGDGSGGDPAQLVQSGIDIALTGGTVTLVSGSYSENPTIAKALTLNGANQGVAGSGSRGAESLIDAGATSTILTISANDVTVDGIQIGTDASTSNATTGIVATVTGGVTITNNIVYANTTGIQVAGSSSGTVDVTNNLVSMLAVEDPLNAASGSVGIILSTISGSADANLTSNNLANAGTGIATYALTSSAEAVIDGGSYTGCTAGIIPVNFDGIGGFSPSQLTIQNVTMSSFVTDTDVTSPDTEVGVYVVTAGGSGSDDITITMDNLDISGVGNGASNNSGIIVGDFPTASDGAGIDATITNCNIHDNSNRGIYTRGGDATTSITQSSITGNGFDPHAIMGNPGFSVVARENSSTTVSNCFITNPAALSSPEDIPNDYYVSGLHEFTGASLTVSGSNLNDNGNGFIAETSGIDLSGNYFNSTDAATINTAVNSNDFTPYLGLGTDTDLITDGFQGDLSALTVTPTGTQTAGGRLQEGYDLLAADGTLTLLLSTYSESITIDKNISIAPESGTSIDDITINGGNLGVVGNTITINNSLTMTNGIFDIDQEDGDKSDDPVFVLPSTVNGSSYASDTYFEGKIESSVTGSTTFTFHVGDEGYYRPTSLSPTTTATFQVGHVFGSTPMGGGATNPDITNLIGDASGDPAGTIESVLNFRYWDIDVASGVPGTTDVALQVNTGDNATDPADLGMTRFDGSDWEVVSLLSSSGPGPFTVTGQTLNFSAFSIYSIDVMSNPLPVDLIEFKGKKNGNNNELAWTTLTEINSDYFQVEHSQDGVSFRSIGSVKAHGNSSERRNYQFEDRNILPGIHYYRLKMVDFDESYEYSPIIQVAPDLLDIQVLVYPNPVTDLLNIEGVNVSQLKRLDFYDLNARRLKSLTAIDSHQISVTDLPSGQYVLRLEMIDGSVFEGKLIKN